MSWHGSFPAEITEADIKNFESILPKTCRFIYKKAIARPGLVVLTCTNCHEMKGISKSDRYCKHCGARNEEA